jgi:putative heme-binding domain-containing protein
MLAKAPLTPAQIQRLAPAYAQAGPVELKELLKLARKTKDAELAQLQAFATALAQNPALISQQESLYRTAFSNAPAELFETLIHPAYTRAEAGTRGEKTPARHPRRKSRQPRRRRQRQATSSSKAPAPASPATKSANSVATIGPDLTRIGAIRTERDLLESILFPSATLARDYEAHLFETRDGQTHLGVIRSHTAEGLLIIDVAGQEKNLPHTQIIADTPLPTSLMPMGLDQTLPEADLLHLTAYLRSLQ